MVLYAAHAMPMSACSTTQLGRQPLVPIQAFTPMDASCAVASSGVGSTPQQCPAVSPVPWSTAAFQQASRKKTMTGMAINTAKKSASDKAVHTVSTKPTATMCGAHRKYSLEQLRAMIREVLLDPSKQFSTVARAAGFESARKALARYYRKVVSDQTLQHGSPEQTLAARLSFVDSMVFDSIGNPEFTELAHFSTDELDAFTRTLELYGDMGWPMDYREIRSMFNLALCKRHARAGLTGPAPEVSMSFVGEYVRNRPELKAYKTSHVDPLRAKKATAEVRVAHVRTGGWGLGVGCVYPSTCVSHVTIANYSTQLRPLPLSIVPKLKSLQLQGKFCSKLSHNSGQRSHTHDRDTTYHRHSECPTHPLDPPHLTGT